MRSSAASGALDLPRGAALCHALSDETRLAALRMLRSGGDDHDRLRAREEAWRSSSAHRGSTTVMPLVQACYAVAEAASHAVRLDGRPPCAVDGPALAYPGGYMRDSSTLQ